MNPRDGFVAHLRSLQGEGEDEAVAWEFRETLIELMNEFEQEPLEAAFSSALKAFDRQHTRRTVRLFGRDGDYRGTVEVFAPPPNPSFVRVGDTIYARRGVYLTANGWAEVVDSRTSEYVEAMFVTESS